MLSHLAETMPESTVRVGTIPYSLRPLSPPGRMLVSAEWLHGWLLPRRTRSTASISRRMYSAVAWATGVFGPSRAGRSAASSLRRSKRSVTEAFDRGMREIVDGHRRVRLLDSRQCTPCCRPLHDIVAASPKAHITGYSRIRRRARNKRSRRSVRRTSVQRASLCTNCLVSGTPRLRRRP